MAAKKQSFKEGQNSGPKGTSGPKGILGPIGVKDLEKILSENNLR